ncbi:DNA-binding protein [Streptomyces sp. NPDC052396]|uniref:DNA-binding protein n=1 Tax=Streptomyces sp. NPDC052396 TaxID=3365689 RepID=UPI0037D06192
MIPHSRPVTTEAEIAERVGVPLATWRRRDAPHFRAHVASLFPNSRYLIYDLAQTDAYLTGKPIPPLPTDEHPEDHLDAKEAAAILGINAKTVHAYATQGYLSRGETLYGTRVWPRREIEERRDNPPGQGKGGGRVAGRPQPRRKAHPYQNDPRLQIATDALAATSDAPISHTATELARQHGGSPRTWERLLSQARKAEQPQHPPR